MGDRLGAASLGAGAAKEAFLVLRQLLDTSRAGEGSVPAGRARAQCRATGRPLPLTPSWGACR